MLKLLKTMRKKELLFVFCSLVFIVAQVWLDLKLPDFMTEITMSIQMQSDKLSDVMMPGLKMLACAAGSLASACIVAVFASKVASGFTYSLREKQFAKVESFSMEEISRFSTASLITRATNDVNQIQIFIVMGMQALIKAPIMAAWAIMKIAGKNRTWTMTTGVAVLCLMVVVGICIFTALPVFRKMQTYNDNINRIARENLTGLKVVRAYNAEKYQTDKFNEANDILTNAHWITSRTMASMFPSITLVLNGLSLAIYWLGAYMIENASMAEKAELFSNMIVFSSYAVQVVMSFMMLIVIFIILPRAQVSAKRINEILETKPAIVDGSLTESETKAKGEIEFRNVSFRYPDSDENVISDISFKAARGETVAVIGSTGCGKSTLINLIPRFYDATEGEVLVDGTNVKKYRQTALRNKIGYVPQKAFLFSGDLRSNIAYGENGRDTFQKDDIVNSVYTAQAADFVDELSEGYDSYVAQGGTNFSGGQRQRLAIARALCRRAEILIFDDSFSALDYKTDRALRKALEKESADVTKVIVAQRIGTIRDADRIIVLDEGRMAGIGSHDELMKNCEVYRQIAYSQLSKEELENG